MDELEKAFEMQAETGNEAGGVEEELQEKTVETVPEEPAKKEFPVVGSMQALKDVFANVVKPPAGGTAPHNPEKIKGDLQAKKGAEKAAKKARKIAKNSRRQNRGKK